MVRPAFIPHRVEEGNPADLNERINPNSNNERARNNVRHQHFTRRNTRATREPVRDRVVTQQILQQAYRPWRRARSQNTEHDSMILRSRSRGTPSNQRSTRNRPRIPGLTSVRQIESISGFPTASDLLEQISPRPGPSNADPQPGTSRHAGPRPVPNRRHSNLHELGNIQEAEASRPGTSHGATEATARSLTRPRSRQFGHDSNGRVLIPPPYWRPDLVVSSSEEDAAISQGHFPNLAVAGPSQDHAVNAGSSQPQRPATCVVRPDRSHNTDASTSSGRTHSHKNTSLGKCPRDQLKAQLKSRREAARLRRRNIVESDTDDEQIDNELPSTSGTVKSTSNVKSCKRKRTYSSSSSSNDNETSDDEKPPVSKHRRL